MLNIEDCDGVGVSEDDDSFFENDTMLAHIRNSLRIVSFKLQIHTPALIYFAPL
jgi:hypothetical protein